MKKLISRPVQWSSENDWLTLIQKEKALLDEIHNLGLKTQRFEISSLEIHQPGASPYSIQVLVTKDFESLCQEEAIAIFNHKGNTRVIGTPPDFVGQRKRFEERLFVQKMFAKIINEYAIALTFSLPISIERTVDDSVHYSFELSKNANEPPVARYMFWDVVSDFRGIKFPEVPTLSRLKVGNDENKTIFGTRVPTTWGLRLLANKVAEAMATMNNGQINGRDFRDFLLETQTNIELAIDDDHFLNQALVHARKICANYLNNLLTTLNAADQPISSSDFIALMKSAISTSDLNLVKQYFQLPNATTLPKHLHELLAFARPYENQAIIEYLENEKRLEISERLTLIDNTLTELKAKISQINQFHYAKAYDEAQTLFKTLSSNRENYKAELEKNDFNATMENNFKTSCVTAITTAKPILEKDLDWGPYIKNLVKLFFNTILAKVGREHLFFKLHESESLKFVQQAAMQLEISGLLL